MAHGPTEEVIHAKAILDGALPKNIEIHGAAEANQPSRRFILVA
jgi:hypothetical protein